MTYTVPMTPEGVNPLTLYRQGQLLSLDECARKIGISISTLLRTEQGCYENIPPVILRYLSDHHISRDAIILDYRRFRVSQRIRTLDRSRWYFWGASFKELIKAEPEVNPFILWREGVLKYHSRLAFCKDLCLHPSTVKRYEDGLAERMPGSMIEALCTGPVMIDWEAIDNEYREWRAGRKSSRSAYQYRT